MNKWEYEIDINCDKNSLRFKGNNGWELVAISRDDITRKHFFYFKRPKIE